MCAIIFERAVARGGEAVSVRGSRPSNVVAGDVLASSSFRACTLRLPSVVSSRRLSSLNVRRSLTASALMMPSRRRSWISRSRPKRARGSRLVPHGGWRRDWWLC